MPGKGGRPTVVVVGCGFGGMTAAKKLRRAPVRTVVLDRNNYHLFAPLIYQVSTALLDPSDIAEPVRGELRRIKNCEFRQATVSGFDFEAKKVLTDVGEVNYDYLVVAAGSRTNFMGNATLETRALGMKTLTDAIRLRNEVLARFEAASWVEDGDQRRRLLSFVVAGGGSTGVETAGALAELCYHVLQQDFHGFDKRDVSITLLEGSPDVLAPYDPVLRDKARRHLERLGVRVRRATRVAEVHENHVLLTDGTTLPASVVVWTAGVCGSDLARALTEEPARGQRVPISPDCRLLGHDDVFVVGDLASMPGTDGRPLPMLAPVATQQAKHAAKMIVADVTGGARPGNFRYRDKGFMSTIGRGGAVVQMGKLKMSGPLAWLTWMAVHLLLICSRRSQISILSNWLWHIVSRDRHARAIYDSGMHPPAPAELAPPRRQPLAVKRARLAQEPAEAAAQTKAKPRATRKATKPASKPASKPAARPAARSATKPAAKAAAKPAARRRRTPVAVEALPDVSAETPATPSQRPAPQMEAVTTAPATIADDLADALRARREARAERERKTAAQ